MSRGVTSPVMGTLVWRFVDIDGPRNVGAYMLVTMTQLLVQSSMAMALGLMSCVLLARQSAHFLYPIE
ncbi:hypothetical protein BDV38DRAFT_232358 [Aspergillus pseudotamarii]|uniref:Uncharacterized protein n=1 Tax=Aspergillus pseudotamarii TaxID=132259 RepID=A0A5N6TCN9_ASPPS|nr:uncharacterized protein BDV38DRAFT_232358 [Aspergillus pseudotamarii]KAE8143929.1 hypothetical protein BDV38DRAFT_232358 [Aspergillus pseudotamarii]